jgi:GT2 family glycosyltransferase
VVDRPVAVSGINAGACIIRRQAYDEVGGWDTSFFLDYEDMELSIRLWQHGWNCRIQPHAKVYHAVGATNNKIIDAGLTVVGQKRYASAISNQMATIYKTFTGVNLLLPPVLILDRLARDLLNGRWRRAWLDLYAGWLTLRRTPDFLSFRSAASEINRRRPGQDWFTQREFDIRTISDG